MADLLIRNIGELATPIGNCEKKGTEQGSNVTVISKAAVAVEDGLITFVGNEKDAPSANETINAGGRLVTPGLVDAHTHLVFGGWRQNELALKLEGASYLDILKSGGGILSTVRSTRAADIDELYDKSFYLLNEMMRHGTTTVEAKSGYGLTLEDERKQLETVSLLQKNAKADIVSTFLGAHAIPEEYKENREDFIKLVCNEMLPMVKEKGLAEFCDIFCETAVFTVDESREILKRARDLGFMLKIHADEIDSIGGAQLAAELNAVSADHLIAASDEGIEQMAKAGVIATLLPATSFYLDKSFARARTMLDRGMAVAVASDFNPGSSPSLNLQFAMNLACLKYKLTPKEALTASTLNAAASIKMADKVGSIENGKQADLVIWDAPDLNYIFYRYGSNLVSQVIKKGEVL